MKIRVVDVLPGVLVKTSPKFTWNGLKGQTCLNCQGDWDEGENPQIVEEETDKSSMQSQRPRSFKSHAPDLLQNLWHRMELSLYLASFNSQEVNPQSADRVHS